MDAIVDGIRVHFLTFTLGVIHVASLIPIIDSC